MLKKVAQKRACWFPRIGGPCLGSPLTKTTVYWGEYWGSESPHLPSKSPGFTGA